MRDIKILLITPVYKGIGGISNHVRHQIKWLKKKGIHTDIVSSENILIIKKKGLMNISFMIFASLKTVNKEYDVIHAHNIPSALPMKFAKGKKILTIHGFYVKNIKLLHGNVYTFFAKKMEEIFLSYPDRITAISKKVAEYYTSLGYDTVYIPNAIDLEEIPKEKIRLYDKQIIFAGRLSSEKGVDILIRAIKDLEDIHLLIFGEGPEEERLKNLSKGSKNIHFLGFRPNNIVLKYLKGSDIYVQPSRTEGLSTSILEAMACKVPVIATDVGGNSEVIENGVSGILINPEDSLSLRKNIVMILEDEKYRKILVENAYRNILEKYNWEVVIDQYIKLYQEVLEHDI